MSLIITSDLYLLVGNQLDQEKAGEMNRLFNAALVDHRFCNLLLTQPGLALTDGYNGEQFHLSFRDRQFILTAKSPSLADLAMRWVKLNNPETKSSAASSTLTANICSRST